MADMVLDTVHYDVLNADIRILLDNEHSVWFFGSDLGKGLGLSNINKNIAELPDGITSSYTIEDKFGRHQTVNIVSEALQQQAHHHYGNQSLSHRRRIPSAYQQAQVRQDCHQQGYRYRKEGTHWRHGWSKVHHWMAQDQ